jgi:integrase
MAKEVNKLDVLTVAKQTKRGHFADGNGLYLQVTATGNKSWIFRYMRDGKARHMGLGAISTLTLKDARKKASEMRAQLLDGKDPLAEREAKATAIKTAKAKSKTFSECVDLYLARKTFNNVKHRKQWRSTLETYAYPHLRDLPVSVIDISDIKEVLDPIWKGKTETASRLQGRIKTVIDFAIVSGYREKSNPAIWSGYLDTQYDAPAKIATVKHMPSVPYGELNTFLTALRKHGTMSAKALEFLILTAVRSESVRSARWSQIDKEAKVWTIPKEFTKTKRRDHQVPLSDQAMAVLKNLETFDETDLLFPAPTLVKMSDNAISKLMRDMRANGEFTGNGVPHGFRSTFSTWRLERTTHSQELGEFCLMHEVGDAVYQAYQRSNGLEKRRAIMQDWATFMNSPYVEVIQRDNVVELTNKKAVA